MGGATKLSPKGPRVQGPTQMVPESQREELGFVSIVALSVSCFIKVAVRKERVLRKEMQVGVQQSCGRRACTSLSCCHTPSETSAKTHLPRSWNAFVSSLGWSLGHKGN